MRRRGGAGHAAARRAGSCGGVDLVDESLRGGPAAFQRSYATAHVTLFFSLSIEGE